MNKKANSSWRTIKSNTVYKNPFIEVVEDKVITPNGKEGIYGYIKIAKTIGIVALDYEDNIYLCKQDRYIFKDESLEIPRGFVEKNETTRKAAERELLEEAYIKTDKLEPLGSVRTSIGLLNEEATIFLARNIKAENYVDEEQEIKEVKIINFNKVLFMIQEGKIKDGLTISAIHLAQSHINNI